MVFLVFRRAGAPHKDILDTQEVFCNDLGPDFFGSAKIVVCAWIAHGLRVDWPPDLETLTDRSELKNDAGCTQKQLWRPILRPIRAISISGGGPAWTSFGCLGFGFILDAKLLGWGTCLDLLRVPRILYHFGCKIVGVGDRPGSPSGA